MTDADLSAAAVRAVHPHSPFLTALQYGAISWSLKGFVNSTLLLRKVSAWWNNDPNTADLVKTYQCRPSLPIRIFFPKGYERNSKTPLPTVFVIHGGGFLVGDPMDDDLVNRRFADTHNVLVVELNYRKGPGSPFPVGLYDLEALLLAAHADTEYLPIDKSRIAFSGFSAGGCLALGLCQLPKVRETVKPSAVIPVYPVVDQSIYPGERAHRRRYKTSLQGLRGNPTDLLSRMSPYFVWSYMPYGQDLRDPLLSPYFAPRELLPKHVWIVAAELDQLSHEAWRMACKLGGRREPPNSAEEKPGQEQPAAEGGKLITKDDERFYFKHEEQGGGSVQWLLVPDVVHGFNLLPPSMHGDKVSVEDARAKSVAYENEVGKWLHNVVWKD
ncbi:Alpha/Beta hydrolase protein [Microdochium bolleyi]|uniref:Alpha/Beta hydrolase protein n=1 Tax=Microdochium bolleyi TaxID=196109 RepID=A0A136JJI2_9PEZI|nr:Alpha/Beta hydrolase protein [Microdochium bolleyi]